eukprot:1432032-Amphidinium_carterae.1
MTSHCSGAMPPQVSQGSKIGHPKSLPKTPKLISKVTHNKPHEQKQQSNWKWVLFHNKETLSWHQFGI